MRRILFLFSLLLTFLSCNEKEEKATSRRFEKETYELVLFCLSLRDPDESIHSDKIPDKLRVIIPEEDPFILPAIESAFPKSELNFIHKQLADTTAFDISNMKLPLKAELIEADTIQKMSREAEKIRSSQHFWKRYYDKYGTTLFTISKPVFSRDGKTAVISFGTSYGRLSGSSRMFALKRTSKGWQIVKTLRHSIS